MQTRKGKPGRKLCKSLHGKINEKKTEEEEENYKG